MYDQTNHLESMDIDSFHNFMSNQATDERFYDNFCDLKTVHDTWKHKKLHLAPPTPPATPDKNGSSFQYQQVTAAQHRHVIMNNSGLQVVPDMNTQSDEEWMWIQHLNKQQQQQQQNMKLNVPPATNCGGVIGGVNCGEVEQARFASQTGAHTHLYNNISPISPLQQQQQNNNKRSFTQHLQQQQHFSNSNQQNFQPFFNPAVSSTDEQYFRQLAYEKIRSEHDNTELLYFEPTLSRATHNVLERQRRNDLKLRFSILRDNIPELQRNDKAPKIQILKKATHYLKELKSEEQRKLVDLELEKQRKLILFQRVKNLQNLFSYST